MQKFQTISASELPDIIDNLKPLLLDLRPHYLFAEQHLRNSINVNIPSLIIKRLQRGITANFHFDKFIVSGTVSINTYNTWLSTTGEKSIVMYDGNYIETTTNSDSQTLLHVIHEIPGFSNTVLFYLDGGILGIQEESNKKRRFPSIIAVEQQSPTSLISNIITSNIPSSMSLLSPPDGYMTNASPNPDISPINSYLSIGSDVIPTSSTAAATLIRMGYTHVLNMAEEVFDSVDVSQSLGYLHLGIKDDGALNLSPILHKVISFIDDARKKQDAKILIHCRAGKSRSVMAAVAYLIMREGVGVDEAIRWVVECRPCALMNVGFVFSLKELGKKSLENLQGK